MTNTPTLLEAAILSALRASPGAHASPITAAVSSFLAQGQHRQAIATTLSRMETRGMIVSRMATAGGRPARVYDLTDLGTTALTEFSMAVGRMIGIQAAASGAAPRPIEVTAASPVSGTPCRVL